MEVFIRRRFSSPIGTHCPVIVIRVVLITHDTHHHQMTPTSGDSHLHQVIVIYIRWQLSSGDTHETSNSHHPMTGIRGWFPCDSDGHQEMMAIPHDSHPSPITHHPLSAIRRYYSPTMRLTNYDNHCSMGVINQWSLSEDDSCQR